jgi:hypothetical protein
MLKEGFAGEHFQGYGNDGAEIVGDYPNGSQRVMRKMGGQNKAQHANEQEMYDSDSAQQ